MTGARTLVESNACLYLPDRPFTQCGLLGMSELPSVAPSLARNRRGRSKPNDVWLRDRIDRLLQMVPPGANAAGGFSARPWTLLKLAALDVWIGLYLHIQATRFRRLVFVDLFGGSGLSPYDPREGVNLTIPGSSFVAAHRRTVTPEGDQQPFFHQLVSVDTDKIYLQALTSIVERCGYRRGQDFFPILASADEVASHLGRFLRSSGTHAVLLVDPEDLDFSWASFETIVREHDGLDVIFNHLVAGASRSISEAAKDRFYGDHGWRGLNREGLSSWFAGRFGALRPVYEVLPIRGGAHDGSYRYDLLIGARRTRHGSPWGDSLSRLRERLEHLNADDVRHVLRTRGRSADGSRQRTLIEE